jgi:hypothetical protein
MSLATEFGHRFFFVGAALAFNLSANSWYRASSRLARQGAGALAFGGLVIRRAGLRQSARF